MVGQSIHPPPFAFDFFVRRRFQSNILDPAWQQQSLSKTGRSQRFARLGNSNHPTKIKPWKVWKGVYRGNFLRVKVPVSLGQPRGGPWYTNHMFLLPSVMTFPPVMPSNFMAKANAVMEAARHPSYQHWTRFYAWWSQNWGTVAMNVGSVCTLIGFTCTDVLELRTFSMCGSIGAILYNLAQTPIRTPPILWSSTFASVNATKIYQIRQERGAAVHLTASEEEIYNRFFLPHGVTPKQFETIYHKATHLSIPKDDCIIKKDDKLDHIYLIVDGTTKANIRGRHLTAASFSPDAHETKQGGASGAWVGEMAFLEAYFFKEQSKRLQQQKQHEKVSEIQEEPETTRKDTKAQSGTVPNKSSVMTGRQSDSSVSANSPDPTVRQLVAPGTGPPPRATLAEPTALYTIVAKEDCRVLQWSHQQMEELLAKSTDLRASMTRAMTQAIVGKVINFTVSKQAGVPTWSAWLDDWKYSAASDVKVVQALPEGKTALGLPEDGSLEGAAFVRGIATKDTVPEMP